jgi:pimeloyl-ACP methyl ester carboxylesterase
MPSIFFVVIVGLVLAAPARAASVDGIELHSETAGSGPTIVFVHGWTCDTSSWRAQLPAFDDRYRVIALDLPGHGRSESPEQADFSMDLFAQAVEAVRAEAGADEIVLVGHSMGVPVIKQYAIKYPDRVAGLVAVDGPLDLRSFGSAQGGGAAPAMTLEARENMIRGMFVDETPDALREHILTMMLGAPAATANGAVAAMFDPSIRTADVVRAPVLAIVAGTAQLPDAEATKEIVPNFEATRLSGTGHFLMMEKPEEFNRLLTAFLDRIEF